MSGDCQREMTLQEWVEKLPEIHRARKEYAALIINVENSNSPASPVQHLQAKIRAIADGLEISYRTADPMAVDNAVNELRELSAM